MTYATGAGVVLASLRAESFLAIEQAVIFL